MLYKWAIKHGVSLVALNELRAMMGVHDNPTTVEGESEAAAQQQIRLSESKRGNRLWRNNVGATMDESGRFIRFGLANDSKKMNTVIKSSDLIGITPYTVKPDDVGVTLGLFTSIEVKAPGWKYLDTARERAQLAWIKLIISLGGIAQFATGSDDIKHDAE